MLTSSSKTTKNPPNQSNGISSYNIKTTNNYNISNFNISLKESIPEFSDILSIPSNPEDFFTIIEQIGKGGYGSVYKAQHKVTKQIFAIKIIKCQLNPNDNNIDEKISSQYQNIQSETNLMKLCNSSKYIVKYYGSYFSLKSNSLWLILEYCQGGSVIDLMLAMDRTFTEIEIASIIEMTLKGLIIIHGINLIHRDIKGANILIDSEGYCKIGDFGVGVKLIDGINGRKSKKGSPYWMSPQVVRNSLYDCKTDIWSLGITCMELINGEPPNSDIKPLMVMKKIGEHPPNEKELFFNNGNNNNNENISYSKEFRDFVMKCLIEDPNKRPMAKDLINHEFIKKFSKGREYVKNLLNEHLIDLENYRKEENENNNNENNNNENNISYNTNKSFNDIINNKDDNIYNSEYKNNNIYNEIITDSNIKNDDINPFYENNNTNNNYNTFEDDYNMNKLNIGSLTKGYLESNKKNKNEFTNNKKTFNDNSSNLDYNNNNNSFINKNESNNNTILNSSVIINENNNDNNNNTIIDTSTIINNNNDEKNILNTNNNDQPEFMKYIQAGEFIYDENKYNEIHRKSINKIKNKKLLEIKSNLNNINIDVNNYYSNFDNTKYSIDSNISNYSQLTEKINKLYEDKKIEEKKIENKYNNEIKKYKEIKEIMEQNNFTSVKEYTDFIKKSSRSNTNNNNSLNDGLSKNKINNKDSINNSFRDSIKMNINIAKIKRFNTHSNYFKNNK